MDLWLENVFLFASFSFFFSFTNLKRLRCFGASNNKIATLLKTPMKSIARKMFSTDVVKNQQYDEKKRKSLSNKCRLREM